MSQAFESPLQLRKTLVRNLELKLHPEITLFSPPVTSEQTNATFSASFAGLTLQDFTAPPTLAPFYARLGFMIEGEPGTSMFARLGFELDGLFTLPAHVHPDMVSADVLINSLAVLYGTGRGLVSLVTGTMQTGSFTLPSLDVGAHFHQMSQHDREEAVGMVRGQLAFCRAKFEEMTGQALPGGPAAPTVSRAKRPARPRENAASKAT